MKKIVLIFFGFFSSYYRPACQVTEESKQQITDLIQFCAEQKGFNLLGKFDVSWSNQGYTEKEFSLIHELGFNFVRLPLDYRTYTKTGDWDQFIDSEVYEIDQATEWGIKYGVHVCINLHRAPGFCVNAATLPPNQQLNLWTDSVAQNAFVRHWEFFANRYKDISPDKLSFNLVNEPTGVTEEVYVKIMKRAINSIHNISPDRIIFVDGLEYGRIIISELKGEPNIAQAIHCYDPFGITHYRAEWVDGSDTWPLPRWPMLWVSDYLYGPWKSEYESPLVIEANIPRGAEIIVNVRQVSVESTLQIKADSNIILSKKFICGPDTGADFSQVVNTQWGYQNISNKDYSVVLPSDGSRLTITNTQGDWMTFNKITIKSGTGELVIIPGNTTWGAKQDTYKITSEGKITDVNGNPVVALSTLTHTLETAHTENIPVMIQEFGVYNKTPHEVTLSWLTDVVSVFNKNKVGYAMWNLIGSMGIINSERTDCTYEPYRGKLLDREMTAIMQSTGN